MVQRARKLIGMSQDDLSTFARARGRIRDRCLHGQRPQLFITLAIVQGADRGGRAGDAPRRRGDIWM
jgi:hypothetical protein